MTETKKEDYRTDQEKRQDTFDKFVEVGNIGKRARIVFDDNRFTVNLVEITNDTISLRIIRGKKHFFEGDTITLSRHYIQDVELIKKL